MADRDATTKDVTQHLEDALDAAESDEVGFHVRQALQLLGIRD